MRRVEEMSGLRGEIDMPDLMRGRAETKDLIATLKTALRSREPQLIAMLWGMLDIEELKIDDEFQTADRALRSLCTGCGVSESGCLLQLSSLFDSWAEQLPESTWIAARRDHEIAFLNRAIQVNDFHPRARAIALLNRGTCYGQRGEVERAIADYTAVIELTEAPVDQKAEALVNRGITYGQRGEVERAIADYKAVLELPEAPVDQKAIALVNRGVCYSQHGDNEREIADYTAVVDMPDAVVKERTQALNNRGWRSVEAGNPKAAIDDALAAILLGEQSVNVFGILAVASLADGQTEAAIEAYRSALQKATLDDALNIEQVLEKAGSIYGELAGVEAVRSMIADRKAEREREASNDSPKNQA